MRFALALTFVVLLALPGDGARADDDASPAPAVRPLLVAQLGHSEAVKSAVFSPDGRHVLTAGGDYTVRLWETETGQEVRRFDGHSGAVYSAVFSRDGKQVLTASDDKTARLWETATGQEVRRYEGHSRTVRSAVFSPDGRYVLTACLDSTARLWDASTGAYLCSLVSFRDGNWAVVDAENRFDASNAGDVQGLHWVVGMETISLEQLKDRYYDPGLLAKYLGHSKEPLRSVKAFTDVALFPSVDVQPPTPEDAKVRIALTNRGGGIGKVVVLVNGKEVAADARGGQVDPKAAKAELVLDLAGDPRVLPGAENTIEVLAYNAEGYLRSRGGKVRFRAPGSAATDPPALWAIVCGISDYRGDAIDLRYAARDAEAFADALGLAARSFLGKERVHLALLSTSGREGTRMPTRENVTAAFEAARVAKPQDILVIYLSGHGVNGSGDDGDFHYLLSTAAKADLADPEVRKHDLLSSAELFALIQKIPAVNRQVLILDTCASGRLVEQLTESRSVSGNQVRAMERLKDRTGLFVLAGCAADKVSYEAGRFGQGLLTYAVLLGMKGGALRDDEYVDVSKLFDFAADQVPALAKDIGGVQRPIIAMPKGGASFDIGKLDGAGRGAIHLEEAKPVFVRSSFQESRKHRDMLGLELAVDAALRDLSAKGGRAAVVFVDGRGMPQAYEVTGGYRVEGDTVKVEVVVWRGEEAVARFELSGPKDDVTTLAAQVAEKSRAAAR